MDMAKAYSNDLRQGVLKDLLAGCTAIAVENKYSISSRTARNWLRLHRQTGDFVPRPRKGKVGRICVKEFEEYVVANPNKRLKDIGEHFNMGKGGAEYYMKKEALALKKRAEILRGCY